MKNLHIVVLDRCSYSNAQYINNLTSLRLVVQTKIQLIPQILSNKNSEIREIRAKKKEKFVIPKPNNNNEQSLTP